MIIGDGLMFLIIKMIDYIIIPPHSCKKDAAVYVSYIYNHSPSAIHLSIVFVSRLKFIPNLITFRPSALKGAA